MAKISALSARFNELERQLASVEATKRFEDSDYMPGDRVNEEMLLNWRVKAKNLLSMACGKESEHYKEFSKSEEPGGYRTTYDQMRELKAIFLAAKEDFEGGYLNSFRSLVQADLFSDELDQAAELLRNGYKLPAAVVAGVVLETTLRQMCVDAGLSTGKIDKMNADLAKFGAYNLLIQKRITALAGIRNSAAHGRPEEFKETDVSEMITYIENFVAERI